MINALCPVWCCVNSMPFTAALEDSHLCYMLYKYDNGESLRQRKQLNKTTKEGTSAINHQTISQCIMWKCLSVLHINIQVVLSVTTSDRYKSLVCTVCLVF